MITKKVVLPENKVLDRKLFLLIYSAGVAAGSHDLPLWEKFQRELKEYLNV